MNRHTIQAAVRKTMHGLLATHQSRVVILLYHRVIEVNNDPFSLCVPPKLFEEQLQCLRRNFNILSLSELAEILSRKSSLPQRAVVLTFDDGYADNFWNARPLLQKYEVPATFFIVTQHTNTNREFWWDELEKAFFQNYSVLPEFLRFKTLKETYKIEKGINLKTFNPNFFSIWGLLRMKSSPERDAILEELRAITGNHSQPRSEYRSMSDAEISEIAKDNLFEIGAHTESHNTLSALDLDLQKTEIQRNKNLLEDVTGRPVRFFAYPFGDRSDYSLETTNLIRDLKFSCACAAFPSFIHRSSDLFQLPRFSVGNGSREHLEDSLNKIFKYG